MNDAIHSPTYAVSSRACAWRGLDWWHSIGIEAGSYGIDLDLTSRFRRRSLGVKTLDAALARSSVTSVWIRATDLDSVVAPGSSTKAEFSGRICLPERTVVVHHDAINEPTGDLDGALTAAARLRVSSDPSLRIALAIEPTNPSNGREHLHRLQTIRHRAAEWDVDLALDLTGRLDETWEAEAALLRMGRRLALIRIGYRYPGELSSPKRRLIRRVLTTAADIDFSGIVAIAPRNSLLSLDRQEDAVVSIRQSVSELRQQFRRRAELAQERQQPGRPT
jgi:hypothetical protein